MWWKKVLYKSNLLISCFIEDFIIHRSILSRSTMRRGWKSRRRRTAMGILSHGKRRSTQNLSGKP
jgi:hypothetical protein